MKKLVLLLLVAVAVFAANSAFTTGIPINAHPQPPVEYEFYWDDGIMTSGWIWFTGGNYWAVQFDEVKTGDAPGMFTNYGVTTYPGWPDSTFQGCYMHVLDDLGGYPGTDLDRTFLMFTTGGVYEWIAPAAPFLITTGVFYVANEQYGNYPAADSQGVDATAGTHNWTGYQGSWVPTTIFGDFMIRCYWDDEIPAVQDTSWGAIKVLY